MNRPSLTFERSQKDIRVPNLSQLSVTSAYLIIPTRIFQHFLFIGKERLSTSKLLVEEAERGSLRVRHSSSDAVALFQGLIRRTELEALLVLAGAIIPEDYIQANEATQKTPEEDEDEDFPKQNGSQLRKTKIQTTKPNGIRGPSRNNAADSDSDFDM